MSAMFLPNLARLSLAAPTAMHAGEPTMSLWGRLPHEIEVKIAKLVLVSFVGFPQSSPLKPDRTSLHALRSMRQSFMTALDPIRLLYKTMDSVHHADAFVEGVLLILEAMTERHQMGRLGNAFLAGKVRRGCDRVLPDMNQSLHYYNAIVKRFAAMLQTGKLSPLKFQIDGWRVMFLVRIFRSASATAALRRPPPLIDILSNALRV